jgi:uncharacterized protein (TIGR03437 family)
LYIYGDFGSGRIWGLRRDGGQWVNRLLIASGLSISTFGEDEAGELYVADHDRGGIYQFVPVGDPPPVLTVLSAASFRPGAIAPESIATIFGTGLSSGIESASRVPLPANLAGTSATVTDGRGTPLPASLYFVSPRQINLVVPAGAIAGPATVTVQRADGSNISARAQIARVAPALFSLNASGEGVAAGSVMRLRADGSRSSEDIARLDDSNRTWVVRRVAFGPENEQLILTLYGTGFRLTPQPGAVVARIGGILAPVTFAGAQPEFPGLDQLNIPVPRALDDRGEVDVIITVDGQDSNPVRVGFE